HERSSSREPMAGLVSHALRAAVPKPHLGLSQQVAGRSRENRSHRRAACLSGRPCPQLTVTRIDLPATSGRAPQPRADGGVIASSQSSARLSPFNGTRIVPLFSAPPASCRGPGADLGRRSPFLDLLVARIADDARRAAVR